MLKLFFLLLIILSCFTIKAQLNFEWVNQTGAPNANTYTNNLHYDGVNILSAGKINSSVFGSGGTLYKYNSLGDTLFFKGLIANNNFTNSIERIGTDGQGNIYAAGNFYGTIDLDPGTDTLSFFSNCCVYGDVFFIKLNPNGDLIWAKIIRSSGYDIVSSLIVQNDGNFYLSGSFSGSFNQGQLAGPFSFNTNGLTDSYIIKFDSSGNYIWAKNFGSTGNDEISSLQLNSSNNLVVTGKFGATVDFDPSGSVLNLVSNGANDVFVMTLDSFGDLLWAKNIGGTFDDSGKDLVIDSSDNIYITGLFQDTVDFNPGVDTSTLISSGSNNIFVVKLDVNGNYINAVSMACNSFNEVNSIDLENNKLFIAGRFFGTLDADPGSGVNNFVSAGQSDIFLSCLNTNLNFIFASKIGNASSEGVSDILVKNNSIYLSGNFVGTTDFDPGLSVSNLSSSGSPDGFTLKLVVCSPDSITPDIAILPDLNAECELVQPSIPTATNNCGNTITGYTNIVFPLTNFGTNQIIWTFEDASGNIITQTQNAIVTSIDSTVSVNSNTLSANASGYTYVWLNCSNNNTPVPGQTGQSFTALQSGSYAVSITNANGCSVTSDCIQVNLATSVNFDNFSDLTLYPNPVNSMLYFELNAQPNSTYKITDINGKELFSADCLNFNTIDLSDLPSGIYLINVYNANANKTFKINKI
jgi:hypothetical protein